MPDLILNMYMIGFFSDANKVCPCNPVSSHGYRKDFGGYGLPSHKIFYQVWSRWKPYRAPYPVRLLSFLCPTTTTTVLVYRNLWLWLLICLTHLWWEMQPYSMDLPWISYRWATSYSMDLLFYILLLIILLFGGFVLAICECFNLLIGV